MYVQPYLFFAGRCDEALEYYRTAIGVTDIEVMRFKDAPDPVPPGVLPPGFENKVMHGMFRVGGTAVLVTDGTGAAPGFQGFSLAIQVKSEAEAKRLFEALAKDGEVGMPLGKTFWSPAFGSLTDRFGVSWMINVEA